MSRPNQKPDVRSSSRGRKVLPGHARPARPALLKRGSSYNAAAAHGQASGNSRLGPGWSTKLGTGTVTHSEDDQEDNMASFLQFCATCERQIVTPGGSILYCSEACREKDVSQPTPTSSSPTFFPSVPTYDTSHSPDIIPQRSPTVLRPVSQAFSDLSLSSPASPTEDPYSRFDKRDSGIAQYSGQLSSGTWYGESNMPRRPRANRASTATESCGLPSLVHSPSSSVSTVASFTSARPVPSRHNKSYSAHSGKASEDLVTPCTATPSSPTQLMRDSSYKSSASTRTSFRVAEAGDLSYEKLPPDRRPSDAQGSLKQLFSHEAMKAPPNTTKAMARIE